MLILQAQSSPLPLAKSNEPQHVLLPRAGGELAQDGNRSSEGPSAPLLLWYDWGQERRSDKTTEAFPPWSQSQFWVDAVLASLAAEPPALLGPPCTANIGRINSKSVAVMCRGRAVLGCCGTLFYTHHYGPKQARGTLDPNTAQAATGTLLKVLKAVLGVGQEQRELRSLRKAESRDVSLWLLPTPNRSDICFISRAYLLF